MERVVRRHPELRQTGDRQGSAPLGATGKGSGAQGARVYSPERAGDEGGLWCHSRSPWVSGLSRAPGASPGSGAVLPAPQRPPRSPAWVPVALGDGEGQVRGERAQAARAGSRFCAAHWFCQRRRRSPSPGTKGRTKTSRLHPGPHAPPQDKYSFGGSGESCCLRKPRCFYPHIRSIYMLIEFFITKL